MRKRNILNRQILKFWENAAASKPSGKLVTRRDINQVSIEINTILGILNASNRLLDVDAVTGLPRPFMLRNAQW